MPTDEQIEQEIQNKGLTAPRVTLASIEARINSEYYFTAAQGVYGAMRAAFWPIPPKLEDVEAIPQELDLLTICVLVLDNGFTVHGISGVASPENFDAEIGRKIARQNAINQIWPLEGYLLREKLAAL